MEIKVVKQPHQGVIYPGLAMTAFSSAPQRRRHSGRWIRRRRVRKPASQLPTLNAGVRLRRLLAVEPLRYRPRPD